ncbi:hypothetical protein AJ87_21280 [Rhizobium yanglingense]|nr:hypothetical protein AJ87_21280 [Rhizobium yanglingense]
MIMFRSEFGRGAATVFVHPDITALGKMEGVAFPSGIAGRVDAMKVMNPLNGPEPFPLSGTVLGKPNHDDRRPLGRRQQEPLAVEEEVIYFAQ